jgi:hypothetical protein
MAATTKRWSNHPSTMAAAAAAVGASYAPVASAGLAHIVVPLHVLLLLLLATPLHQTWGCCTAGEAPNAALHHLLQASQQ